MDESTEPQDDGNVVTSSRNRSKSKSKPKQIASKVSDNIRREAPTLSTPPPQAKSALEQVSKLSSVPPSKLASELISMASSVAAAKLPLPAKIVVLKPPMSD